MDFARVTRDQLPPTDLQFNASRMGKLARKVRKEQGKEVTPWECYVTLVLSLHELRSQLHSLGKAAPESDTDFYKLLERRGKSHDTKKDN